MKAILLKTILLKAILLTALLGMSLIVACKQPSAPKEEPSDPKPKPTPKVYNQPVLDSIFADRMRPGELELFGRFDSASARVVIGSTTLMIRSKDSTHILCTLPIIGRGSAGPVTVQDLGGTSKTKLLSMWGFSEYYAHGVYHRSDPYKVLETRNQSFFMRFDIESYMHKKLDSIGISVMDYNGVDSAHGTATKPIALYHGSFNSKDTSFHWYAQDWNSTRLYFNPDFSIEGKTELLPIQSPERIDTEWWPTFTQFLPK